MHNDEALRLSAVFLSRMKTRMGLPDYVTVERFNAPLFGLYVVLHGCLLAAPFTFTGAGLSLLLVLYFITICLGITLGYHRLLSHRSYKTYPFVAYLLALLGCLAFQRGPIWWTACHRLHHAKVDREGDPHSPLQNVVWAHGLWPFFHHPDLDDCAGPSGRLAADLVRHPGMRFLERHYTLINIVFLAALLLVGYGLGGGPAGIILSGLGGLCQNCAVPAYHLAGQFRKPPVWIPQLRDARSEP